MKNPVALDLAIEIFGKDKVITAEQAAKAWELEVRADVEIRYSEETLRHCATQNRADQADWRLIFVNGLSLHQQREKLGVDSENQPGFSINVWWLKYFEDCWAKIRPEAQYYLVNMKPQFADMDWYSQERIIDRLVKEYDRCNEAVFAEAILTVFMISGERITDHWYHWGRSRSVFGDHITIGFHSSGEVSGLDVNFYWDSIANPDVRVVLCRQFEF